MKNTCGFFIYHNPTQSILLGHVTSSKNEWSIPKGGQEVNESIYEAALRELAEESNINREFVERYEVFELNHQNYSSKHKRLCPFLLICDEKPEDVRCTSDFIDSFGNIKPEFDGFVWACVEELQLGLYPIHLTQRESLLEIIDILSSILEKYKL